MIILKYKSNLITAVGTKAIGIHPRQVFSTCVNGALIFTVKSGNQIQQRTFSAAGRPQQAHETMAGKLVAGIFQYDRLTKVFCNMLNSQHFIDPPFADSFVV